MKKIISAIMVLLSISVLAEQPLKLDPKSISAVNDIVGAIKNTKDALTFSNNVSFDEISVSFSADGRDSVIDARGMLTVGGDMACGNLGLNIVRSSKFNGWGFTTTYKSTLDKSQLSDQPFCVVQE